MQNQIPEQGLYFHVAGRNYGPVDMVMIRKLFSEQRINRGTNLWYQGLQSWITVGDIPEFDRRDKTLPSEVPPKRSPEEIIVARGKHAFSLKPDSIRVLIQNQDLRRTDYGYDESKKEWVRADRFAPVARFFDIPRFDAKEINTSAVMDVRRIKNNRPRTLTLKKIKPAFQMGPAIRYLLLILTLGWAYHFLVQRPFLAGGAMQGLLQNLQQTQSIAALSNNDLNHFKSQSADSWKVASLIAGWEMIDEGSEFEKFKPVTLLYLQNQSNERLSDVTVSATFTEKLSGQSLGNGLSQGNTPVIEPGGISQFRLVAESGVRSRQIQVPAVEVNLMVNGQALGRLNVISPVMKSAIDQLQQ